MVTTRIRMPDAEALAEARRLLLADEVVAIPTETVYGLAGVARSERALLRIFGTKERPLFDPLIVHVAWPQATDDALGRLDQMGVVDDRAVGREAREIAERLIARFWPGPLTLVLPRHADLPDLVSSGLATVAVRAPAHPVAARLLAEVALPLAAPSANRFGRISPTSAADVAGELDGRIALILDGGPCEVGVESAVVAVGPAGELRLLRSGGVTAEAIEAAAARPVATAVPASLGAYASPGMTASHYAPRKPLRLLPRPLEALDASEWVGAGVGLLQFSGSGDRTAEELERRGVVVERRQLSPGADLDEAARRLFAQLRALDDGPAEVLWAEPCPQRGLGHAIMDRLVRASAPRHP